MGSFPHHPCTFPKIFTSSMDLFKKRNTSISPQAPGDYRRPAARFFYRNQDCRCPNLRRPPQGFLPYIRKIKKIIKLRSLRKPAVPIASSGQPQISLSWKTVGHPSGGLFLKKRRRIFSNPPFRGSNFKQMLTFFNIFSGRQGSRSPQIHHQGPVFMKLPQG